MTVADPPPLPRHGAAPPRPRLSLAVVRPGRQRDRQPDHPDRAAVPGVRPDRLDAGDRGADALPADPDPAVRAGCRLAGRCRRSAAPAPADPGRARCVQPVPRAPRPVAGRRRCRRSSRSRSSQPVSVAVDQPARSSSIPRLVPPERLPAAIALNQLNFQMASIVGPAIGGILIATVGLAGAYAVDLASFVASFLALLLDPAAAAARGGDPARARRRSAPGLRFARQRRAILGSFVIDLNAMIFGMPTSLFPVLALDVFETGPAGLGLMAAAPAAGAFLGALFSGWVSSVQRTGPGDPRSRSPAGDWPSPRSGWSPCRSRWRSCCLALAGAADVFSAVFRSTLVQLETPDEPARPRHVDPHPRRHQRAAPRRHRGGRRRGADDARSSRSSRAGSCAWSGVGVVARRFPELADYALRARRVADAG